MKSALQNKLLYIEARHNDFENAVATLGEVVRRQDNVGSAVYNVQEVRDDINGLANCLDAQANHLRTILETPQLAMPGSAPHDEPETVVADSEVEILTPEPEPKAQKTAPRKRNR